MAVAVVVVLIIVLIVLHVMRSAKKCKTFLDCDEPGEMCLNGKCTKADSFRGRGGRGWRGGRGRRGRSFLGYRPWLGYRYGYYHPGYYWPDYYGYYYPGYTPYLRDYAGARSCPAGDPTQGRPLCQDYERDWEVEDLCRTEGMHGDALVVWRESPDGDKKCYTYHP